MDPENPEVLDTAPAAEEMPPMPAPMGAPGELAVPLKALAQPDDAEQVNEPAQGDTVSFTVDAQIVRIVGDVAYIKPMAVNGTTLEDETAETVPDDEAEGMSLRGMAEQQGAV